MKLVQKNTSICSVKRPLSHIYKLASDNSNKVRTKAALASNVITL